MYVHVPSVSKINVGLIRHSEILTSRQ